MRPDLLEATRSQAEGCNGHAKAFWDWSEEQVASFCRAKYLNNQDLPSGLGTHLLRWVGMKQLRGTI